MINIDQNMRERNENWTFRQCDAMRSKWRSEREDRKRGKNRERVREEFKGGNEEDGLDEGREI